MVHFQKKERKKKRGESCVENLIETQWKRVLASGPYLVTVGLRAFVVKGLIHLSTFYLPIGLVTHRPWEPVNRATKPGKKEATSDVSAVQSIRANNRNDDALSS